MTDTTSPLEPGAGAAVDREQDKALISALEELGWVAGQVGALRRANAMSAAPLGKLIRRLIATRLMYWLAERPALSERRRKRFLRSAQKRDPMLLTREVEAFCAGFQRRLAAAPDLGALQAQLLRSVGLSVTAIVPSYNHAPYLRQRLDSILGQSYPLVDVLVLDDGSSDGSRAIIEDYAARYPDRLRAVFNETNSGSVFAQWQKGHELATGDLVWFCESDDFAEPDFVERLIPAFRDPAVMLGFGRIEFANADGTPRPGMDHYREAAEPGLWGQPRTRPAAEWFAGAFGVKNVIANVGGSLWRRAPIAPEIWAEARGYRIMGDWFLYAAVARGGMIAYEPGAVSYFRQHGANTSGKAAQARPEYYREYARLMTALKRRWEIPDATLGRFVAQAREIHRGAGVEAPFDSLIDESALRAVPRDIPHVLMAFMGFSVGGGEIFPIHLANALHRMGVQVSMLQMSAVEDTPAVRGLLDPGVPVYGANALRDRGAQAFLRAAGVSIVHSHLARVEVFLLDEERVDCPYVVTLHGSYEATNPGAGRIAAWMRQIDRFAYLAERNLSPFPEGVRDTGQFLKIRNAMPLDPAELPGGRAGLGIAEGAVVFAFVARGVEGKGWSEAVQAFKALRALHPEQPMALVFAGDGPARAAAEALAAGDPAIHFLGFIAEVHGLYRIADVALAPTRYPGESYPLSLIQALQVGLPCIATDVGEIAGMMRSGALSAGLLIAASPEDDRLVADLTEAMGQMLAPDTRARFARDAAEIGRGYAMETLAQHYLGLYREVLAAREAGKK